MERDKYGRPIKIEMEMARYGTISDWKEIEVKWIHPRVGLLYDDKVVIFNPQTKKHRIQSIYTPLHALIIALEAMSE